MNRALPIAVEVTTPSSSMVQALLCELAQHLQNLAQHDQSQTIDLSSLPISDADRCELERLLGRGEVEITLNTLGQSLIHETTYSGIWWIKHFSADDKLLSELIEVSRVPAIIHSHPDDIAVAAEQIAHTPSDNKGESND